MVLIHTHEIEAVPGLHRNRFDSFATLAAIRRFIARKAAWPEVHRLGRGPSPARLAISRDVPVQPGPGHTAR